MDEKRERQKRDARYYAFVRGFEDEVARKRPLYHRATLFRGGNVATILITPDIICAYNYGRQEAAHTMRHVREFAVGAFNYQHDVRSDQ